MNIFSLIRKKDVATNYLKVPTNLKKITIQNFKTVWVQCLFSKHRGSGGRYRCTADKPTNSAEHSLRQSRTRIPRLLRSYSHLSSTRPQGQHYLSSELFLRHRRL